MTVKELIAELEKFPPDQEIEICCDYNTDEGFIGEAGGAIISIFEDTNKYSSQLGKIVIYSDTAAER